jgi:hypothetical protein
MADIKNKQDLEKWLEGKPVEVSRVIALRCALRVLPLVTHLKSGSEIHFTTMILQAFRCISCAFSVSLSSQEKIYKIIASNSVNYFMNADSAAYSSRSAAYSTYSPNIIDSSIEAVNYAVYALNACIHSHNYCSNSCSLSSIWLSITDDCHAIENSMSVEKLLNSALWLNKVPKWFWNATVDLKTTLLPLNQDWDVWTRWFDDRLNGLKANKVLELLRIQIRQDDWAKGAAHVNALIRKMEEERAAELAAEKIDNAELPPVPAQSKGIEWVQDAQGAFTPVVSFVDRPDQETADLALMLPYLLQCAQDLECAIQGSVSNSLKDAILPRVEAYRRAVDKPAFEISIDEVHFAGVRLRNASERLKQDIKDEETPQVAHNIGEALDSVIMFHGPFVLGTKRGAELDQRARDHNRTREQDLAYKVNAQEFAAKVSQTSGLVSPEGKDLLTSVNAEIATGPFPERSTVAAENVNQNLLIALSKGVLISSFGALAGQIVISSGTGKAAIVIGAACFDVACTFMLGQTDLLKVLALSSGDGMAWLPIFLDRLKAKFNSLK